MTPNEVITLAQGICADYTDAYPTTKSVMYQRINARQRQLFALAAEWDREFYGACATGTLQAGCIDLAKMDEAGLYPIERIDDIRIFDRGTAHQVEEGERVHIVPAYDAEQELAPRVTVRSGQLAQVGKDLEGVTSLTIWYSRRPKSIDSAGRVHAEDDVELEIGEPWDWLLVWDLARDLIRRTLAIEADVKTAALELIGAAEAELLASYETHVTGYAHARQDRFDD